MSTVKTQVEDYIKHDRTLLGGKNLYNQLPSKNKAFQNYVSRQQNTPELLDKLIFELCRLAGIPDRMRKIMLQKPVVEASKEAEPEATQEPLQGDDALLGFDPKTANYQDALKLLASLDGVAAKSRKKDDVFEALSKAKYEALKKK